jgi:hypothetical protein
MIETLMQNFLLAQISAENIVPGTELRVVHGHVTKSFHRIIRRFLRKDAHQTMRAQKWLEHWWKYHNEAPDIVPIPTSEAYAMILSGWDKEREPTMALSVLQDMQDREGVQPQVLHFETCLNIFVHSVNKDHNRQVAYDAETVLLQMTRLLENNPSDLLRDDEPTGDTRNGGRIRALKNLNKVIHCWVDSRSREAAGRVTAILDLVDDVFIESAKTPEDCAALAEAYSHSIRAWSHAATSTTTSTRKALAQMSEDFKDPMKQSVTLLLRLEDLLAKLEYPQHVLSSIPLKTWRRIYGSAISACGSAYDKGNTNAKLELALNLWERFRRSQYGGPDTTLYNHILQVCGKLGETEVSDLLWHEMNNDPSASPDLNSFNWRLLAYKNSMKWPVDRAKLTPVHRVWLDMKASGFSPDIVSYNTYIACHVGTLDISIAQAAHVLFVELLKDKTCRVSIVSLNALLGVWARIAEKSDKTFDHKQALRFTITALSDLLQYCCDRHIYIPVNNKTNNAIVTILGANKVPNDKQASVFQVLDKIAGKQ